VIAKASDPEIGIARGVMTEPSDLGSKSGSSPDLDVATGRSSDEFGINGMDGSIDAGGTL